MGELVDLMGEWGNKDVNAMTPAERQIMSEFTRNVQGMFGTRQDSGSTGKPPGTGQEPTPPQDVDDNTFGAPEQKKPNNRSPRDSDENFQHILRYMQNASDRLREFFENLPPDIFKGPPPGGGGAAPVPGRGRRLQRRRR